MSYRNHVCRLYHCHCSSVNLLNAFLVPGRPPPHALRTSPVHRLVSAFFYCKTFRGDPLCATFVLDARTADLGTFAKHWGNFGMRQASVQERASGCWANKARELCGLVQTEGWNHSVDSRVVLAVYAVTKAYK